MSAIKRLRIQTPSEIFLLPGLLSLGFFVFAIIKSIYLSFYSYKLGLTLPDYVGISNYRMLLNDPVFITAIKNTLLFVGAASVTELAYGVLLAVLLYWSNRKYLFIPFLMIPLVLPTVNIVVVWRFLLHPQYGFINQLLTSIGLSPINPLNDPKWALPTIILLDIWQMTPFVMIIILAGLMSIPKETITAAMIDGAKKLQLTLKILLPMTKNVIFAVFLLRLIDAFRIFAKVYLLTRGGPGSATETLELQIYNRALRGLEIGLGSTMSVIFILLSLIVIIPYIVLVLKNWYR